MNYSQKKVKMKCFKFRKWIHLYRDGELSSVEAARLKRHVEKCPTCAEEFLHIQNLIFMTDELRRHAPELHAPEEMTQDIMHSIGPTKTLTAHESESNFWDRIFSFLLLPKIRFGFALMTLLLFGLFFIQESLTYYQISRLEVKMQNKADNQVIVQTILPGTKEATRFFLYVKRNLSVKQMKTVVQLVENELDTLRLNPFNPVSQTYINLQIVRGVLREYSDVLGVNIADGVDPTEIAALIRNRNDILQKFRLSINEEVDR